MRLAAILMSYSYLPIGKRDSSLSVLMKNLEDSEACALMQEVVSVISTALQTSWLVPKERSMTTVACDRLDLLVNEASKRFRAFTDRDATSYSIAESVEHLPEDTRRRALKKAASEHLDEHFVRHYYRRLCCHQEGPNPNLPLWIAVARHLVHQAVDRKHAIRKLGSSFPSTEARWISHFASQLQARWAYKFDLWPIDVSCILASVAAVRKVLDKHFQAGKIDEAQRTACERDIAIWLHDQLETAVRVVQNNYEQHFPITNFAASDSAPPEPLAWIEGQVRQININTRLPSEQKTRVHVKDVWISFGQAEAVLRAITDPTTGLPGLERLHILNTNTTREGFAQLFAPNSALKSLLHLHLSRFEGDIEPMLQALIHESNPASKIRSLEICPDQKGIAHKVITKLSTHKGILADLSTLKMFNVVVDDQELNSLVAEHAPFQSLKELSFCFRHVSEDGFKHFCSRAAHSLPQLETLCLPDFSALPHRAFDALSHPLNGIKTLKRLEIGGGFRSENLDLARELFGALSREKTSLQNLEEIRAMLVPFCVESAAMLASSNSGLKSLRRLCVGSCHTSNEALTRLALSGSGLSPLKHLEFWAISARDAGLAALAHPSSSLRNLETLEVHASELGDESVRAFAAPGSALSSLRRLNLSFCKLTDEGIRAIARPDSCLTNLQFFECSRTPLVTQAALESLMSDDCPLMHVKENIKNKAIVFGYDGFKAIRERN